MSNPQQEDVESKDRVLHQEQCPTVKRFGQSWPRRRPPTCSEYFISIGHPSPSHCCSNSQEIGEKITTELGRKIRLRHSSDSLSDSDFLKDVAKDKHRREKRPQRVTFLEDTEIEEGGSLKKLRKSFTKTREKATLSTSHRISMTGAQFHDHMHLNITTDSTFL